MVASATQNLIDRGADGCFIDWVDMDGFYEKCGYKKWQKAYYGAWRWVLGWAQNGRVTDMTET